MMRDTKSPDLPGAAGLSRVLGDLRHLINGSRFPKAGMAATKLDVNVATLRAGIERAGTGKIAPVSQKGAYNVHFLFAALLRVLHSAA